MLPSPLCGSFDKWCPILSCLYLSSLILYRNVFVLQMQLWIPPFKWNMYQNVCSQRNSLIRVIFKSPGFFNTLYTCRHQPYMAVLQIIHSTAGPQQFWSIKKIMDKTAAVQQCYGWTSNLLDLSSAMDGFGPTRRKCRQNCRPWQFYGWFWAQTKFQQQQNCRTSAVLWMVLGPP